MLKLIHQMGIIHFMAQPFVHQRTPQDTSQYSNVSTPLKLDQDISELNNIPATVTELILSDIWEFKTRKESKV